jgi:hypothetical protein
VGNCFLEEYRLLLALAFYGGLKGTKDLVGLGDGELGDGNICTCGVFDRDGWSVLAMAEEWSA